MLNKWVRLGIQANILISPLTFIFLLVGGIRLSISFAILILTLPFIIDMKKYIIKKLEGRL